MTRTLRVLFLRTVGRLAASQSTFFCIAGFLALSAAFFTRALAGGDGGTMPIEALWAVAAAPFLPVLAALVTMRLVADARATGRLELLLTVPVLEREIVFGQFLGAFAVCVFSILLYLTVPVIVLPMCAPAVRGGLSFICFMPAVGALVMQSALWCAVGLLASAIFRHAAVAAFAAIILMLALPHAAFEMAVAWSPVLRSKLASMPFEAHIVDLATGLIRLPTVAFYGVLICFSLFAATKAVAAMRFCGRGVRGVRFSTITVVLLAFLFSCLVVTLTLRINFTVELPFRAGGAQTSARTRQILSETHGDVYVTCFLARRAPEFRAVSRLLRGLEATARSVAGTRLVVEYVDPRWELGRAVEMVRKGADEGTIVFRRGNRKISVDVESIFADATNNVVTVGASNIFVGETACASALQRLNLPALRETVYWTTGHGESTYASYDSVSGMSDIARELRRDGYGLAELDLANTPSIPVDCAVLVVAGAREPFSRVEMARLEGWMKGGGRMLVLTGHGPNAGVAALLADIGIKALPYSVLSSRTLTGADVVVRDFADHPITQPLIGGTAVFAGAVPFVAAPTVQSEGTVYTELARTDASAWGESDLSVRPWTRDASLEPGGPLALAVALERGGGVAKDVALHPMRVVVIGDVAFVSNGALSVRGNANRDVFLNSVAWLAGLDALTASRAPGNAIATGMDRGGWFRFGILAVFGPALAAFILGCLMWCIRRRGQ